VTMLRDGGFVVAWLTLAQGGASGVYAQRFARNGLRLGGELRVSEYTTGALPGPQVAPAAAGGFVVAWSGSGAGDPDGGVFARRYDRGGVPAGSELLVNTTTTGVQSPVAVAGGPAGFVVVWSGPDANGLGVFGQRYDASGAAAGAEFLVNTYTTDAQYDAHVAMARDGRFTVVWSSRYQDSNATSVYAQRFDGAGARLGGEFKVNGVTSSSGSQPRIAADGGGGFTVAWTGSEGDTGALWGQRFGRDGNTVGSRFMVTPISSLFVLRGLASDASGDIAAVWEERPFIIGGHWSVRGKRLDRTHAPREAAFSLPASPIPGLDYGAPAVASDDVGNLITAWSNVVAQRFGGLYPAAMVVDRGPSGASNGNLVLEPGEAVVIEVAWSNDNGLPQTFTGTASFSGPGTPGDPIYALLDGTAAYGTVPNGGAASCGSAADCYATGLSIPTARPAQHWDATLIEDILPTALGMAKAWSIHVGGSFDDVPVGGPYYRFVETLLHHSVTAGCAADSYCPAGSTTREQMAVFVLVAKESAEYAPPACATPVFNDVPASSPFCRWIEELARRGVAGGCGGGNYCPTADVTREQMAVFVLRTLDPALSPPACTTPVFADVPASSPFCQWIEELARRGVVSGCGGGNYCPTAAVTREQMAVFLSVTFNLFLYGP
jgi:S-layer family protein